MNKNGRIFKSALILGTGIFIAKILGALYRIPLTNLVGGYGLGLYQTVFPVYAVLLDFAGAGVPSALSKIISSKKAEGKEESAREYLNGSVRLLSLVGLIFSAAMIAFSRVIARLQGNESVYLSYILLAPAVFLVAIISCYRGYFQGLSDMKPTAVSQVTEQAVKLLFGLSFVTIFLPDVKKSVAGAVFAITLSEAVALLFLAVYYKKSKKSVNLPLKRGRLFIHSAEIIKHTVPVTLTGIAIPFSHFIDSFLIVNLLSGYSANATSLYGIFSGVAATVINLPVSVCYAVAAASIPAAAAIKNRKELRSVRDRALSLTFLLSVAGFLCCYFLSEQLVNVMFSRLAESEKTAAVSVLKFSSFNVIFLSLLQTENAVLFARGYLYRPLLGLGLGIAVKTVLSVILIKNPALNIYGAVIAQTACYFLASLINLKEVYRSENENKFSFGRKLSTE